MKLPSDHDSKDLGLGKDFRNRYILADARLNVLYGFAGHLLWFTDRRWGRRLGVYFDRGKGALRRALVGNQKDAASYECRIGEIGVVGLEGEIKSGRGRLRRLRIEG